MGFDRLDAEVQFIGNLTGAQGLSEQAQHFKFPIREVVQWMRRAFGTACAHPAEDLLLHAFAQVYPAIQD
jgi:hypothetical protein